MPGEQPLRSYVIKPKHGVNQCHHGVSPGCRDDLSNRHGALLLADMGRKASEYTEEAAVVAGVAALGALGFWFVRRESEHTK